MALALPAIGPRAELVFQAADQAHAPVRRYSNPADVAHPSFPGRGAEEVRVTFSGDITPADVASAKVMIDLVKSGRQKLVANSIWLAGDGGDLESSMRLGRMLRELGAYTVVAKNDRCMSACVFAFMGGERRSVEGKLGVHRPYFPVAQDFPDRQSRFRNLQKTLRAYIEEMDFPDSLYETVMAVPPESMHFLAPAELKRFYLEGISPSSEDLADAAGARRMGLTMHEYLKLKAKSAAAGRPLHLTNCSSASCVANLASQGPSNCAGVASAIAPNDAACSAAVEHSR